MTQLIRMIAPSKTSGGNPTTIRPANAATGDPGLTISAAEYSVLDVETAVAGALERVGWMALGPVGPTASRPLPGSPQPGQLVPATQGLRYVDLSLSQVVTYDARRGVWIDFSGAAV